MNFIEQISEEISGERAYKLTEQVTQYYRSPGSAGYHAATRMLCDQLMADGLLIEETHYPLDGETIVLDRTMPMAWEPYDARVQVISPAREEIVNFSRAASCLAWWSSPTSNGGVISELIDVGTGEQEADYAGKDLTGKIAFVHNANWHETWSKVSEGIARRGAKGIITDFFLYPTPPIRTREQVPEAVQLLRLEFNATKKYDFWACSVDQMTGEKIKNWLRSGPVQIHAVIKCNTFVGYGENILATIPGDSVPEESVFVLAHSSTGSRPGANCAAGAALLVEIARTLSSLIARGGLPRPKRSVKFLLMSEGLGSYNYLNSHLDETKLVRAAYCLESVGHNQRRMNTTLYFTGAPDSTPSFINDHFAAVLERIPKHWGWVGRNEPTISPIVVSTVPYTPWSDNSTWAAHGIPSTLLMSWPDEYFHSQLLTVDVTDPKVFAYVGGLVASSCYEVANAGLAESLWLAQWLYAKSVSRLNQENQQALWHSFTDQEKVWAVKRLNYLCWVDGEALKSLTALVDAGELPALVDRTTFLHQQLVSAKDQILSRFNHHTSVVMTELVGILRSVPKKNKKISTPGLKGLEYQQELALCQELGCQDPHFVDYVLKPATDEMWNLIDGERNINEIIEYSMLEFNLRIRPESWLPVFEGWQTAELISMSLDSPGEEVASHP